MSGIGGVVSFGNRTLVRDVENLASSLSRRGPHLRNTWQVDSVGLVATSLRGESNFLDTTGYVVLLDGRLENKTTLCDVVNLPHSTPNASLLLQSYLRWGRDFVEHLEGEFAIAVYDRHVDELFCARDHLGLRPFFYCFRPGVCFAFASEVNALLGLTQVPKRINERRILDYLTDIEGIDETTFYVDILKLPAASRLHIRNGSLAVQSYWTPFDAIATHHSTLAATFDAYGKSVDDCIDGERSAGVMLSGGIDSASVAAFAKQTQASRVVGLSIVSNSKCSETIRNQHVRTALKLDSHSVRLSELSQYEEGLLEFQRSTDDPFAPMTLVGTIYSMAKRHDLDLVLDGTDGGLVMGITGSYPTAWVQQGNFAKALREVFLLNRRSGGALRGFLSRLRQAIHNNRLHNGFRYILDRWVAFREQPFVDRSLLNSNFLGRFDLDARTEQYRSLLLRLANASVSEVKASFIADPHVAAAMERYNRLASFQAVEPRHPFMNKSLVESAINLPLRDLGSGGWTKYGFCKAMEQHLPQSVCWPKTFGNLMPFATQQYVERLIDLKQFRSQVVNGLADFVDRKSLTNLVDRYTSTRQFADACTIWHVDCLWKWLSRH